MDSKPEYETVPVVDEHEESLSSTDVDESLMGDEKQWCSPELETGRRQSKRRVLITKFKSYRWIIDTSLLLIITALLLLMRAEWKEAPTSSWQVGGDFTGAAHHIPTQIVKFEANMSFVPSNTSDFFSDKTLATWNTLMPVGTGWGSREQTFFTTSMTHQLHCVFMMARIYSGVLSNATSNLPTDWHSHFLHCVDYLRQSIMCSADMALEAHQPTDADDLGPLDGGWNAHHVCKDYSHVLHYLEGQIADGVRTVLPIDD